jgi:hypothetical protein
MADTIEVRFEGVAETVAAFNELGSSAKRTVQTGLKKAAEPVAASARQKISRYRGASLSTIVPRSAGMSVFVTQRAREVTGIRGDYGELQMTRGMIPALEENEGAVVAAVDAALDDLISDAGF